MTWSIRGRKRKKVWVGEVWPTERDVWNAIGDVYDFCGLSIPCGQRVVIKPNFTWPGWKPGVTTHPVLLETLAKFFLEYDNEVVFVESDGGMLSWKAEDAFCGHGLTELEKKSGGRIRCVSLMREDVVSLKINCWGKRSTIPIPKILTESDTYFVTCPVLKTHCMTEISLAFKNQWGCVPDTYRLRFHHVLGRALVEMLKVIPLRLVIIDGLIALDGNGPMYGDPVEMNLLIGSESPGAASMVGCEIMGIRWWKSRVLRAARQGGMLPRREDIELSCSTEGFRKHLFVSKKLLPNYAAIIIAYSKFLTWLFYLSPLRPMVVMFKNALFGGPKPPGKGDAVNW